MVPTRRFTRSLAALLGALALLCALALPARSESGEAASLAIEFTVQPSVMVAPGNVSMTFVLINVTGRPVQNIYLTSADGQLSEPIGQIGPGESQTLVRTHTVTEAELEAGAITYTVSHDPQGQGEKVVYPLSAAVTRGDAQPGVEFTRQLSSSSVVRGGLVTVTYKLVNTGNVALSGLRIQDPLGDFTGRLDTLDVGEAKTFISRVTLNAPAESAPRLEYAAPSGESYALTLDAASIRVAHSALELSFSVGQSVFDRDTADAVLILTNSGNVDYENITVQDDIYGGVIAEALTVNSGSGPVEVSSAYPLRGEGQYRWHITGTSSAGETLDLRTDTITLAPERGEEAVEIQLEAVARTPKINRAGQVTFDFTITNNGDAMADDALLYEVNRGSIRRLAVLPPGEPTRCAADYDVSESAQFIFCLNYTDAQGRQRTVSTAPIDVQIAPDGVPPRRPDGDGLSLEGSPVRPVNSGATFIVLLVIAGAALTAMITILVVVSARARRERLLRIAAEKKRVKDELEKTSILPAVKGPGRKRKKRPARAAAKGEANPENTHRKG